MFSQSVKDELRRRILEMTTGHPALARARQGKLGPAHVARYLSSLQFLLSQTGSHMERARAGAIRLGRGELASFFQRKLAEEAGHERWAEEDLVELARFSGTIRVDPVPSVVELVEYLTKLIESDPRLYAIYVVCTEYFTVLAGPPWVRALVENCGVPNSALTVAAKHIDADREHADRGFSDLDAFVDDPAMADAVAGTVDRTMKLFDKFFREVVYEAS